MGYTTVFRGRFDLRPPLSPEHAAYLRAFSWSRRMVRDPLLASVFADPLREAAGLPLGPDGGFFVAGVGERGSDEDFSVVDGNQPPLGQPGLWCHWTPTDDGRGIEWNGAEKFYHSTEWLGYVIDQFLDPWGYVVSGEVTYQGPDRDDCGWIVVEANRVEEVPEVF